MSTNTKDWVVVAIAGVTCGGKTSLSDRLSKELPFTVHKLHQDDFFLPEDSDQHVYLKELNHANWDILSSIDMNEMFRQILSITSVPPATKKPGILLVDGNLILNFRPIEELCRLKYYITLSKDECWARRQGRTYQPPDPPGYFDACAWPMYEMYRDQVEKHVEGVVFLDGTVDSSVTFQRLYDEILFTITKRYN